MCELDLEGHMGLELGEITRRRGGLQDGGIPYESSFVCWNMRVCSLVRVLTARERNPATDLSHMGWLLPPKGKKKKESEF